MPTVAAHVGLVGARYINPGLRSIMALVVYAYLYKRSLDSLRSRVMEVTNASRFSVPENEYGKDESHLHRLHVTIK